MVPVTSSSSSSSPTIGRLTSIVNQGLLSAATMRAGNISYQGGYDTFVNTNVYLNVVTKTAGIPQAVFSPSEGVFSVGIERIDDSGIVSEFLNRNKEKVEQRFQSKLVNQPMESRWHNSLRDQALHECLQEDHAFLAKLEERTHNLAVFVLELDPTSSDRLDAEDIGCHDTIRGSISPDCLLRIILSKDVQDTAEVRGILQKENKRIIFIEAKKQKILFCYQRSTEASTEKMIFEVTIRAPDFGKTLKKIFLSEFRNQNKPMYLHTTRL